MLHTSHNAWARGLSRGYALLPSQLYQALYLVDWATYTTSSFSSSPFPEVWAWSTRFHRYLSSCLGRVSYFKLWVLVMSYPLGAGNSVSSGCLDSWHAAGIYLDSLVSFTPNTTSYHHEATNSHSLLNYSQWLSERSAYPSATEFWKPLRSWFVGLPIYSPSHHRWYSPSSVHELYYADWAPMKHSACPGGR